MKKSYRFNYKITPTQVLTFLIAALISLIFFTLTGHAQRPTALTETCPDGPPTLRVQMFTGRDGNIHLNPCAGKTVLVNGSPLAGGGIFSDGSILFQKLNSGMISNDVLLSGDSGTKLTTEHAVKSYVDGVTGFVTYNAVQKANLNGVAAPVSGWTSSNGSFWFSDLSVTGNAYYSGGTFNPNGQQNLVAEGVYRSFIYWLGPRTQTGTITGLTNNQIYVVRIHSWKPATSSLNVPQSNNYTVAVNGGTPVTVSGANETAVVRDITFTATGATASITWTTTGASDGMFVSGVEVIERVVTGSNTIASTTQLGKIKLATAPADAANPIAVGDNDPRLTQSGGELNVANYASLAAAETAAVAAGKGLVLASAVTIGSNQTITSPLRVLQGGKITIGSGVTFTITGQFSAPPIEVFDGAGAVNFQNSKMEKIYPDWFAPAGTADWAAAVMKASRAGWYAGGVPVQFQCKKTYTFSTQINFNWTAEESYKQGIHWRGCGKDNGQNGGLIYTGTGSASAVSARSSYKFFIDRMIVRYNSASFTGILIDLRHADGNPADTAYWQISGSTLGGTSSSVIGGTAIQTNGVILGIIDDNEIFNNAVGIRGVSNDGTGTYANVMTVTKNHFSKTTVGIMNPNANWKIDTNTFEPSATGEIRAMDNDCSTACQMAQGITFSNNYLGDYLMLNQTNPSVRIKHAAGVTIESNWFLAEIGGTDSAIVLDGVEGAVISANRAAGFANFVKSLGTASRDVTLIGNDTGVTNIVLQGVGIVGLNIIQGGDQPNRMSGVNSAGEAWGASSVAGDYGVSIGQISNSTNFGAASDFGKIAVMDGGVSGVLNRQMGYFAPSSNSNGHLFYTWNGSGWTNRFQIDGSSLTSSVGLLFGTDNAVNIGGTAANRPANIYAGTSVVAPTVNVSGATASRALVTDASKNITSSSVTSTELGYLSGVTSAIQTQISANATNIAAKLNTASPSFTGNLAGTTSGANFQLGATNKIALYGDTAALNDMPAGTQIASTLGGLSLAASAGTPGTNKLGAYYHNGTAWKTAWEIANTTGGAAGIFNILPGGGTFAVGSTSTGLNVNSSSNVGVGAVNSDASNKFYVLGKSYFNGNVGIGVTNAVAPFQVNGATTSFTLGETTHNSITGVQFGGLNLALNAFKPFFLAGDDIITRMGLTDGGFLVAGVTQEKNPDARLNVMGYGTTTGTAFLVENSAGTDLFKIVDAGQIQVLNAQFAKAFKTATYAATTAINWNDGNTQTVTLTGNVTFTFANPLAGADYTLIIKQDASGGRTITFPTVRWQGGSAPTWTATGSKADIVRCTYADSEYFCRAELNY